MSIGQNHDLASPQTEIVSLLDDCARMAREFYPAIV